MLPAMRKRLYCTGLAGVGVPRHPPFLPACGAFFPELHRNVTCAALLDPGNRGFQELALDLQQSGSGLLMTMAKKPAGLLSL
jgi:hypothetical protein